MEGNAPVATQILFDVGVWPNYTSNTAAGSPSATSAKAKPSKTVRYEIHYGFPASEIAFTEDPDGTLHGSLEFDVVAYDVFRKRVALLTQTVKMPLRLDEYDAFAAKPYQFTQQIDLPPGQISLHVGILDNVNSKVGTLEVPGECDPDESQVTHCDAGPGGYLELPGSSSAANAYRYASGALNSRRRPS